MPFPLGRAELVVLMAMLMSLNALAIDIMLPALGLMSNAYALVGENDRQWVVTAYIYGMALGSIVYGSLADRYGRKPVLIGTMALYVLFGLLCAVSERYDLLLAARFAQGFAAAAMGVLVQSIIRDRYEGDAMARIMSIIMMVFMAVPVTAPIFGELILMVADWHMIFVALSLFGVAALMWVMIRLPETLHPANVIPINLPSIVRTWKAVVTHRNSVGHVAASGLMMGPLFGYIASAQQVFADSFDAADIFVYIFALNASAMAVCSYLNARIVERIGARRVGQAALIVFIVTSIAHLAITAAGAITLWWFVLFLLPAMGMIGFTGSNFSAVAMQPFGAMAGVASSFQNFARMTISTTIGAVVGLQFDGTTLPLIAGFVGCGLASLACIWWAEGGVLMRRNPPVQPADSDEPVPLSQRPAIRPAE